MASLEDLFSLQGRRALITGSSRGIGRGIALAMTDAGACVALHGSRASEELQSTQASAGDTAISLAADLAIPEEVDRLIAETDQAMGGVDILVLNAAVEIREPWNQTTDTALQQQVSVNMQSNIRLISAFAPAMAQRGWGRVLFIGSVQEIKERPPMLIYGALKAALHSMMRNLARELAPSGVTFNTLSPGIIQTDINNSVLADPAFAARMQARVPMNRFGEVDDCVGAALFLCSPAARYVTGERLLVDGGMHL